MGTVNRFRSSLVLFVLVFGTFSVNTDERIDKSKESESDSDLVKTADEEVPSDETKLEENEEADKVEESKEEMKSTVPTAPWKRLPVTIKIPVNYDIDLPQDI